MRILSVGALALAATLSSTLAADDGLTPQANTAFISSYAKKPGVMSARGFHYRVIKAGSGKEPDRHDCATVYYKGNLINGQQFDATEPGKPATFPVGGLIKGWTEALQMMHEGDEWELVIPADLAYGHKGAGDVIPPDQTLVFDVTLLKVSPPVEGQCG